MPPDLLSFQRDFADAISRPIGGALAVYRNTVVHGTVEALRANYPVVEQILGAEMFESAAADYVAACPSRSPVLALYGARFADWLSEQSWTAELPYLPDVARVERLRLECLFAADTEPLPATLPHSVGQSLQLRLHPATRFGWFSTPAMGIWLAHQSPLPPKIEVEWEAEGALFTRPDCVAVSPLKLDRAAHRLLSGIRIGETVEASGAATARLYPDTDLQAVFESLIVAGAFASQTSGKDLK